MKRTAKLVEGPVAPTLLRLTGPMLVGIGAIIGFNLVDTWFVAQLGVDQLAAISFTFPVVMLVGSIGLGIGTGTVSCVARALGQGDEERVHHLTTDSLLLAVAVALAFAVIGLATIEPLFRALGASNALLPLISEYMRTWYIGMAFVIVPMVGNNALRAMGDTLTPGIIMTIGALLNLALDPLLIFGLGPIPAMGMGGAALATVLTRATTMIIALAILHYREHLIDWKWPAWSRLSRSWREVLFVGLPAMGVQLLAPLTIGLLTKVMATYGESAVAAFGAGSRVHALAIIPVMALGTALVPFVGQNWGAGQRKRVGAAQRFCLVATSLWGLLMWITLSLSASPIARLFTEDPKVVELIGNMLQIATLGLVFAGWRNVAVSLFNAINRPLPAASIQALFLLGLMLPFAWLGGRLGGVTGIFWGLALADLCSGLSAGLVLRVVAQSAES